MTSVFTVELELLVVSYDFHQTRDTILAAECPVIAALSHTQEDFEQVAIRILSCLCLTSLELE